MLLPYNYFAAFPRFGQDLGSPGEAVRPVRQRAMWQLW